ncbi:FAD-dependent oxidoreductase [Chloroflexota bacterium]
MQDSQGRDIAKNQEPRASVWLPQKWDKETDVVVVGYGGAGAVAAITVSEEGGKVILLEKAPEAGGNTSTASGGMRYSVDARQTAQYIKNLGLGSVDDETARSFAETWVEIKPWLEKHGAKFGKTNPEPTPYKNLGAPEDMIIITIESPDGYVRGSGKDLFAFMDRIVKNLGVEVMLNTPVKKLIQNPATKEIMGVLAESEGGEILIKAKKAVIMTCGGFAGNAEMIATYVEEAPVKMFPSGTPYSTGDGIKMVIDVGANLWHMNAIEWGPQGFKPDEMPASFWIQPKWQSWINVNRYGERFRNESISMNHTKTKLEMFDLPIINNIHSADWINSPWYLIFDEKVRQAGPLAGSQMARGYPPFTTYNSSRDIHTWSQDNNAEINRGWIKSADSIGELATKIGVDQSGLQETITNYNGYCVAASDPEYNRKPDTLVPIDTSPYYAFECVVSIVNTQGGPRKNARSQVVSVLDGSPIPRLYTGGEFGSIWSVLYPGACNLPECIVSGIISGRNAAAEISWE